MIDDLDVALERREASLAVMRENLYGDAAPYVLQLEAAMSAERRYLADPTSDERRAEAVAARAALDDVRGLYDRRRAAELRSHTKRLNGG